MSNSALFHYPFEQDLIDEAYLNDAALVVNAPYDNIFKNIETLTIVQNYKYNFDVWHRNGYNVLSDIDPSEKFKTIFCQIPQSKEYSLFVMAQCLNALEDDGVLICLAGNNENGKRIKKWFESFRLQTQSESKQKHRIVWAYKNNIDQGVVDECLNKYGIQQVVLNNLKFTTKPGVYGWNKIDNGSQLLIDNLPDNLKGCSADFGCGYGFLSVSCVHKDIKSIDLFDSDYNALNCAKENLKDVDCQINFNWTDVTQENISKKYDWIVMNPPFHQGKNIDSDIGADFIKRAAICLKPSGMLYMVANSFLPYEKILEKNFKKFDKVIEQNGFKVLFAQK